MTSEMLIQFGISIRRWRKDLGYSQEELGKMAGVSKQYISNIERAEPSSYTGAPTQPSIEVVDKLAKALRRPVQELRDLAGYGIEDASIHEQDRKAEAARTVEMVETFLALPPDRQATAIELVKALEQSNEEPSKAVDRPKEEQPAPPAPKVTRSAPPKRDSIDEILDAVNTDDGGPLSEADRELLRKAIEEDRARRKKREEGQEEE